MVSRDTVGAEAASQYAIILHTQTGYLASARTTRSHSSRFFELHYPFVARKAGEKEHGWV